MDKIICKISLIFVGIFTLFGFIRTLDPTIPPMIGQINFDFCGIYTEFNGEVFTGLFTLLCLIIAMVVIYKE